MADESATTQERTEQPTARRLQQARDEGRVAKSQELSTAAALLAGTGCLALAGGVALAGFARKALVQGTRLLASGSWTPSSGTAIVRDTVMGFMLALMPFALGMVGLVVSVNLAQTRGVMSWKPIVPKLENLSPLAGIKRLVSLDAAFNLVKSIAKLAVLGLVTWAVIARAWPELIALADVSAPATAAVIRGLTLKLAFFLGLAFIGVALADYAFQRRRFQKGLMMSRQEVILEHKETEGDPAVKARIQSIMRARARQRMLQHVPTADVVIVNPTHIAVALRYDVAVAPAPIVVAMGERKLAERIRAIAEQASVPLIENRLVARALLATAKVGKTIPPALYIAVAEILAYVFRLRGGLRGLGPVDGAVRRPEEARDRTARGPGPELDRSGS